MESYKSVNTISQMFLIRKAMRNTNKHLNPSMKHNNNFIHSNITTAIQIYFYTGNINLVKIDNNIYKSVASASNYHVDSESADTAQLLS